VLFYWYAADLKEMTILQTKYADSSSFAQRKFRERGYNQVTTFGSLSKELIPYDSLCFELLIQKHNHRKQTGPSEGIDAVFDVYFNDKDHDKHYLLVDDVITRSYTGGLFQSFIENPRCSS
jgi:predicted amidophosphoribosyltransferase